MSQIIAFIISHVHMDIEWYQPLHSYRFWLVEALDRQLALCAANPATLPYTVDGQVFPVEEYLTVCPEKRTTVRQLVQSGKLIIGPFYTQYDEWIPSGESMIRNCLYGDRTAREFGQPMKIGYLPDNFGHPIQLPQILNGFGIDSLVFMRGMPYISADYPDEFTFQGLDGSRLTAINFRDSYSHIFKKSNDYLLDPLATPYYDGYISYGKYMQLMDIDNPQQYAAAVVQYVRQAAANFPSGIVPVVIGGDHTPPSVHLDQVLTLVKAMQTDIEFRTGSPEDYIRLVQAARTVKPVYNQELIGTRFHSVLLGALSTRAYLKRANFAAETLIEKYAEPLEALAALTGGRADSVRQLDEAWRLLMTNHAHDSFHGSSTDEVHTEMLARFNTIRQIGAGVAHNALADISRQTACWWGERESGILIYQPRPSALPQFMEIWLPVGQGDIDITAPDGRTCPSQILWRDDPETNDIYLPATKANPPRGIERVIVEVPAQATLSTVAMTAGQKTAVNPLQVGNDFLENEYLRVQAADSLLNIWDKKENIWYYGQNLLVETAETGDYWDTSSTWIPSETVLSNRFEQTAEILERGPVRAMMQIRTTLNVPARLESGKRSKDRIDLPVTCTAAIYRGARRVDVTLTINNTAHDHKIALLVDPRLSAATVRSQNAFAILDRPAVGPQADARCVQPPTSIYPFREWLAIADAKRGLAVAVRGLYDYEPRVDNLTGQTSVSLTLLRGVGNMTQMNMKRRSGMAAYSFEFPGGQCLGEQRIEYAFIPYSVAEGTAFVDTANSYLYPPLGQIICQAGSTAGQPGRLPSFAWDAGNIVQSAFKRAYDGDGYILRLFENEGRETRLTLRLESFSEIYLADLNERPGQRLEIINGAVQLEFKPYKIVTLLMK